MGKHGRPIGRTRRWAAALVGLASVTTSIALVPGIASGHPIPALVLGTPCTPFADACVDLATKQAWLLDGGAISLGPVPVSDGAEGHETPTGDFHVEWKSPDHVSSESGVPMPNSVFFAPGGIAFHEGTLDEPSAGCVKLGPKDAQAFFTALKVGDHVQVR